MNRSPWCVLFVSLALAACSSSESSPTGSTRDTVTGSEPCVQPGAWLLTYTRRPGSSPLCPEIAQEAYQEEGGIAHDSKCDDGCTCSDDIAPFPSCSVTWRQSCSGDKVREAELTLTRASADSYAGTATLHVAALTCTYDLRYGRTGP